MTKPEVTKSESRLIPRSRSERVLVAATVSTLLGIAAGMGWTIYEIHKSPSLDEVYDEAYTGKGKCLDETPYDLANGAIMNVNKNTKSGQEIVSILPQAANSYTPSVLFFTERIVKGETELVASDHQTQALLIDSHCPNQPSGL